MTVQRKRHLAKAFSWRIIASVATFIIGWVATGHMETGIKIGAADVIIKFILYYFHERIWYKSHFGVVHDEDGNPINKD